MYLEEEDVIQHIPEELRNRMKERPTYYQILDEKINIAERYIIFNVLKLTEMPSTITEDIKLVMEIQAAILMIENYTLIEPQIFGLDVEENKVKGSLVGRLNSLLKDIMLYHQEHTILDNMGSEEDSFIYKYIRKPKVFDNEEKA